MTITIWVHWLIEDLNLVPTGSRFFIISGKSSTESPSKPLDFPYSALREWLRYIASRWRFKLVVRSFLLLDLEWSLKTANGMELRKRTVFGHQCLHSRRFSWNQLIYFWFGRDEWSMLEAVRKFLQKNLEWKWDGAGLLFFFFFGQVSAQMLRRGTIWIIGVRKGTFVKEWNCAYWLVRENLIWFTEIACECSETRSFLVAYNRDRATEVSCWSKSWRGCLAEISLH